MVITNILAATVCITLSQRSKSLLGENILPKKKREEFYLWNVFLAGIHPELICRNTYSFFTLGITEFAVCYHTCCSR